MAYLWIMTIGFIICLGIVGGTFFYFISSVFRTEDSKRIDLLDSKNQ